MHTAYLLALIEMIGKANITNTELNPKMPTTMEEKFEVILLKFMEENPDMNNLLPESFQENDCNKSAQFRVEAPNYNRIDSIEKVLRSSRKKLRNIGVGELFIQLSGSRSGSLGFNRVTEKTLRSTHRNLVIGQPSRT